MKKETNLFAIIKGNYRGSVIKITGLALIATLFCTAFFTSCKKNSLTGSGLSLPNSSSLQSNSVTGDEFTIVLIPDAQYATGYMDHTVYGGQLAMFTNQMSWIIANKTAENIAYVGGLGDQTDCGDDSTTYPHNNQQWINATSNGGFYTLDAANIPWGVAVGNHEELGATGGGPGIKPQNNKAQFLKYFNPAHFSGKAWFGGGADNGGNPSTTDYSNHYDLFTAGGADWIVIYFEYDVSTGLTLGDGIYTWANNLLTNFPSRKAIVITHYASNSDSADSVILSGQSRKIDTMLSAHKNFFMRLGGHVDGEGYRQDTYNGHTIRTYTSDYQFYKDNNNSPTGHPDAGAGYMRLMKISLSKDLVSVRTISPFLINNPSYASAHNIPSELTDANSLFSKPLFHGETATRFCDFSQDNKTDLGFFDASTGNWNVSGMSLKNYGTTGDIPIPMDYDGDGRTDYAVFRPSPGYFLISGQPGVTWGTSGDIPVPADYDGDGQCDYAVWRPSNFNWYIKRSYFFQTNLTINYGTTGDVPVPGDYDGDGLVDIAMFRPSTNHWYIYSKTGYDFGTAGDIPVPGDYTGDGITDIAVYHPATGAWTVRGVSGSVIVTTPASGDIPCPGDYFGDGKTHQAVYRPSNHTLYKYNNGTVTTLVLSAPGKVVNLPYAIRQKFGF